MKIKIIILLFFICFEIVGCKSTLNFRGNYSTVSSDSLVYNFNMNNQKYTLEINNKVKRNGKFKIIELSSEKTFLICDEIMIKKTSGFEKALDISGDSIVIGVYDGYKNSGALLFEITKDNNNLLFRKTYLNELKTTEIIGKLVKQN